MRGTWTAAALFLLLVFLVPPFASSTVAVAAAGGGNAANKTSAASNASIVDSVGPPIQLIETSSYIQVNFTMFVFRFYKSGYEVIYSRSGRIIANYHNMYAQYYNAKTGKWTTISDLQEIVWSKIDDWHYKVVKRYRDASTVPTTYIEIEYDLRSDMPVKITIRIRNGGQARQYAVLWNLDGVVYENWKECRNADNTKHRLLFGDENVDFSWIALDWQDVYDQFKADITNYLVETSAQGRKVNVLFEIGIVNETATIDPSIVGTSTTSEATMTTSQRKSFYANGRFWVFYSDGTNMVYRTSVDGSSWSSATTVRSCSSGQHFSIWFDGTYLHYAYANSESPLYYRRGTPGSGGTITWSASEQTVSTTYNRASLPFVSVDSSRYVWIGYTEFDPDTGVYYPYVIKSGRNDGTWGTTPSGFPYLLEGSSTHSWSVSVVPLTAGKMLVVYSSYGSYLYARSWSGSAWNPECYLTYTVYGDHSVVSQGDYAHIAFMSLTGTLHTMYSYSGNSLSAVHQILSSSIPVALSIDQSKSVLYAFWAANDHIYYKISTDGGSTWSSAIDWISEETTITSEYSLTSFCQAYTYRIGLVYMTKRSSPYNVKFAYLLLDTAPTIGSFQAPATVYANKFFFLNATINDADGSSDFSYATIEISNGVILKWTASTNTFSKLQDTYGYCTLDAAGSIRTAINTTAYKLSWRIKLSWNYPEGSVSVLSANTKVYDIAGASGSGSASNLFYVEDDLVVSEAFVSDSRINPSQSLSFGGRVYYEGTTIPPEDPSGITVKVGLGSETKGSTATINSDGSFLISGVSGEPSVGLFNYVVYAVTDQASVQNQTISVIVDRIRVSISVDTTRPAPYSYVNFTLTASYEYDNSPILNWSVCVLRNGEPFAYGNFSDGGYYGVSYTYSVGNATEFTYGLTAFTASPVTVCWFGYVDLTVQTIDMDGDVLTDAIVYFDGEGVPVNGSGHAVKTQIPQYSVVYISVEWRNCWVNSTCVNMTDSKSITVVCNVWTLTVNARDSHGDILVASPVSLIWTYPSGETVNDTRIGGSWPIKITNGTHSFRIWFQGQWVSENRTIVAGNKEPLVVTETCWVYSLTVYVTDIHNEEKSGSMLTLARSDGYNYAAIGLSPATAVYHNATHAKYVWRQLANQSSSYTVTAYYGGQSDSKSVSLMEDTVIVLTIPGGISGGGGGGGWSPPSSGGIWPPPSPIISPPSVPPPKPVVNIQDIFRERPFIFVLFMFVPLIAAIPLIGRGRKNEIQKYKESWSRNYKPKRRKEKKYEPKRARR